MAEFHVHGGPAVVASVLNELGAIAGFELARPGEFTRRAFYNGKLDLTQVEGLADLIDAETKAQAAQALRQVEGGLSQIYEGWRRQILRALALAEAVIDFADEDIPDSAALSAADELRTLADEIRAHLSDGRCGEIVRQGFEIAIIGAPNAGKSSLLNALAKRDVAIVSESPGTTRDIVEVHLNLQGFVVKLIDTAGLREGSDPVEIEGVRRARDRSEGAQLRVAVIDAFRETALSPAVAAELKPGDIVVRNKIDLGAGNPFETRWRQFDVSAKTGQGLEVLLASLSARAAQYLPSAESPSLTRARHREALEAALAGLERALPLLSLKLDLAAEDLRIAARAIGRITGRVDVEDLLDVVFAEFCIGK
jgi:tRNA modification GTPase